MAVGGFQWRSLKARVTLTTLVILLLGIWSLALYVSKTMRDDMQHLLGDQQQATVALVASAINSNFKDRFDSLQATAGTISPDLLDTPAALQKALEQRSVLQVLFNAGVFVTRKDGLAIAEFPSIGRAGLNYMDREHVVAALAQGLASVGKPTLGKRVRAASFAITVPLRDPNGLVIGAITGATDLSAPNFLEDLNRSRYGQSGGYLIVDPHSRQIVLATSNNTQLRMQPIAAPGVNSVLDQRLAGFDGPAVNINSQGIEVLTSSARLPLTGWFVIASLPTAEAFAPIGNLLQRTAIATILLTLLAGGASWWLLKRQLKPVSDAAKWVVAVADLGHVAQPVPINGADEVGELLRGFNRVLAVAELRERALNTSERQLETAQKIAKIGSWRVVFGQNGAQDQWTVSKETRVLYGHPEDLAIDADTGFEKMPIEDQELSLRAWDAAKSGLGPREWRHRIVVNGQVKWMQVTASFLFDERGQAIEATGTNQDITALKQLEDARAEALGHLQKIATRVPGLVYQYLLRPDGSSCFPYASDAIRAIYRVSPEEVREDASPVFTKLHPDDHEGVVASIGRSAKELTPWTHEYRVKFDDGTIRWLLGNAVPDRQADGGVLWHGFITDITQRKELESQVHHFAYYDALTNLPNRRLLADRLNKAMSASRRSGRYGAVMALDLDNFKQLNDLHGHSMGDLLLVEVARRLSDCVREVDTVARVGGDEFVVVLGELDGDRQSSATFARNLAEKIRTSLSDPYRLSAPRDGPYGACVEHHCSASIGVAMFENHEISADAILGFADAAMYAAKNAGRNAIHFHA